MSAVTQDPRTTEALVTPVKQNKPSRLGRAPQDTPAGPFVYLLLLVWIFLSAFPLYWMFVIGTGTAADATKIPPKLTPGSRFIENSREVFNLDHVPFAQSFFWSTLVTVIVTTSVLFFCSLAGFAFAKLRFWGRNGLMVFIIATMTIPSQLGAVALYVIMIKIGWQFEIQSVIVPGLVTAFGVFFMRQFIVDAVPDELIEAARVDGCSTFRTYWNVVVPAIRPAAGVLGLFTAAATWNDFQWPLMALSGGNQPTVQVALNNLASGQLIPIQRVMTGSMLATIPLLIMFFIAGKQIVAGIMEGAVKS